MQRHQSANDGAAGLIWLKRGGISRGLLGVDYSCQAPTAPTVSCAVLRAEIYDGVPKKDGTVFAAHRMSVPWEEGNQAFNKFPYAGNLGPIPGSGPGTTWGCQVDAAIGTDSDNDCDSSQLWVGGDDCDGELCYDSARRPFRWPGVHQPNLYFDVTYDMPAVQLGEESSWIVKVDVEEVRTGSVKFYQRQGAQFMAENTVGNTAVGYFNYAPSLDLYGSGFTVPAASVVSPASLLVDSSPVTITFNQTVGGGESAYPARWHNKENGEWGYANPGAGTDWSADIPVALGINTIEFSVFDSCGTEGVTEVQVAYSLGPSCGDGWVDDGEQCDDGNEEDGDCCSATCSLDAYGAPCDDEDSCTVATTCASGVCSGGSVAPSDCRDSMFCYKTTTKKGSEQFAGVSGNSFVDRSGPGSVDLKRISNLCVPAGFAGVTIEQSTSARTLYRAQERSGERALPASAEVTDHFGTFAVKLGKLTRFAADASFSTVGAAPSPAGLGTSYACYVAKPIGGFALKDNQYSVADEFEDRWYQLRRPSMLCLVADEVGQAPANPQAHRMCYSARRAWGEPKHAAVLGVATNDAFGELELDTRREDLLCVPAWVSFAD